MGENISIEEFQCFQKNLKLVDTVSDKHHGNNVIYQTKYPPYEYVMDYVKTFTFQDRTINSYISAIKKLKGFQHKSLAKIQHYQIRQERQMCIRQKKTHVFWNYYNFSLEDAILYKKRKHLSFSQSELIYILNNLINFAKHLKNHGLIHGNYRNDRIFLSPQGHLKLYLLDADSSNRHSTYFRVLADRSLLKQEILSPEQLKLIRSHQTNPNYDIYKAQVFSIGMNILQLMSLDGFKYFYQGKPQWNFQRLYFALQNYRETFTNKFIDILQKCLQQNNSKRPSMEQLEQLMENITKQSESICHCIKLNNGEGMKRVKSQQINDGLKRNQSRQSNRISIINAIQNKLNVVPIETLKSTQSTNSTGQNWLTRNSGYKI